MGSRCDPHPILIRSGSVGGRLNEKTDLSQQRKKCHRPKATKLILMLHQYILHRHHISSSPPNPPPNPPHTPSGCSNPFLRRQPNPEAVLGSARRRCSASLRPSGWQPWDLRKVRGGCGDWKVLGRKWGQGSNTLKIQVGTQCARMIERARVLPGVLRLIFPRLQSFGTPNDVPRLSDPFMCHRSVLQDLPKKGPGYSIFKSPGKELKDGRGVCPFTTPLLWVLAAASFRRKVFASEGRVTVIDISGSEETRSKSHNPAAHKGVTFRRP